jgi:hypothetical protein
MEHVCAAVLAAALIISAFTAYQFLLGGRVSEAFSVLGVLGPGMKLEGVLLHDEDWTTPINMKLVKLGLNQRIIFELWTYNETSRQTQYHGRWCQVGLTLSPLHSLQSGRARPLVAAPKAQPHHPALRADNP